MTRSGVVMVAGVVVAAAASVAIARAGAPGESLVGRAPEHVVYERLLESDFAALGRDEGFVFRGVRGMLPPAQARSRKLWLVYAELDRGRGEERIAFQVLPHGTEWSFGASLAKTGDPCRRDEVGWDCYTIRDGVAVKGQVRCLRPACEPRREDAKALRRLAVEHLDAVLADL